ncbi:unnamed protein product [Paramecium pentaurelia]|uniref:Arp2/3 complex 34 kDa subunit n=1 Tax=Paramecium pentaurelia TaxID=43138 RepID=A0A8S1Y2I4_9CILI|nr:unnamed protein product [Paramecium pentaurelia]
MEQATSNLDYGFDHEKGSKDCGCKGLQLLMHKVIIQGTCFNFNEMFSRAGNYMIDKYYKDYTKEATEVGFHLTFSFDKQYANEEPKIPKNATEAEKAEIQELKLQIRAENQKLFEKVIKDFSQIRRNFYAAVFEQAFDQINKGETAPKFKYQSRENEVVYAIPDKDALKIAYEISFSDNVDRTLANLIITEIIDAKKNSILYTNIYSILVVINIMILINIQKEFQIISLMQQTWLIILTTN